jgi:hypothetical protein
MTVSDRFHLLKQTHNNYYNIYEIANKDACTVEKLSLLQRKVVSCLHALT